MAPRTSVDSSITWASTQPPIVTEPSTRPCSSTTIRAPSLRGVVPRVLTSVATATRPEERRNCSICSRSSLMVLMIARRARAIRAGSAGEAPRPCAEPSEPEGAGEGAEGLEVVGRREPVEERQGGGHPARERLVRGIAQQRVEPDEPRRAPTDPQELRREDLDVTRVPAVREDDHYRAPVEQVAPLPVEFGERGADPRSARPVPDVREPPQHLPVRSTPQVLGDSRESRREREGLDPAEHVLEGVEKLKQEPAVEIHRARDVAEQHEPDLLLFSPTPPEVDDLPAREVRPECPPEVDKTTALGWPPPAARAAGEPAGDLDREPRDLVELLSREGREVLRRQRVAVGDRGHAERLARRVSLLVGHPGLERDPFAPLPRDRRRLDRRRLGATVVGRRDQPAQPGIVRARRPPKGVEAALEGRYPFDARDAHGPEAEED